MQTQQIGGDSRNRNPVLQAAGSLLFLLHMTFSWIPYALVSLFVGPFSYPRMYAIAHAWTGTVMTMCRVLCGIRIEIHGRENIPSEPAVALWKHSSAFETLAGMHVFPRQTWVMKRSLVHLPLFGWVLRWLKPIAIDRGKQRGAVEQVLRQGSERLKEGVWVMIFPEGTRVPLGETRRYGASGALLARENGVPVVPVAHNAGMHWPRKGWLKKPGTIHVVVGPPIPTAGRDPREINAQAQAWIEDQVARLTGLPQPELPAVTRRGEPSHAA